MRRIAVRAIIQKDGKMLLAKLKHTHNGIVNDYYCTIGGGLDDGEPLLEGLKREVIEETGVEPVIGQLLHIQQYADDRDHIEFFFEVTNADDFTDIDLSKSSHGQDEIAEIGFFDPTSVKVLPEFLSNPTPADTPQIHNYL